MNRFTAWAIDTRSDEGHGYIGRYWTREKIPASLEGCRTALFKTRATARQELKSVRTGFPRARVIKVNVTISVDDISRLWRERPAGLTGFCSFNEAGRAWVEGMEAGLKGE